MTRGIEGHDASQGETTGNSVTALHFAPVVDHYYQAGTGVRKFQVNRWPLGSPDPWVAQCETEEGARAFAKHLNECVQSQALPGGEARP